MRNNQLASSYLMIRGLVTKSYNKASGIVIGADGWQYNIDVSTRAEMVSCKACCILPLGSEGNKDVSLYHK